MAAFVDHTSLLECEERDGVVVSLKKRARVLEMIPLPTDHTALYAALEEAGVPAKWTQLDSSSGQNLLLVSRSPKIIDGDTGTIDVDLTYNHVTSGTHQDLRSPVTNIEGIGPGVIFGKVKSSVRQFETNRAPKFRTTGELNPNNPLLNIDLSQYDGAGKSTIVTAYRPPAGGAGASAGAPVLQGGKVSVLQPNSSWTVEGFLITNTPWIIETHYLGCVNRDTFLGRGSRTVMCTEVQWEIAGRSTGGANASLIYWFSFEFQHDPSGFDPDVTYRDPQTQRPPPNANPYTGGGYYFMTGNMIPVIYPMTNPNNLAQGMLMLGGGVAGLSTTGTRPIGLYKLVYYRERDFYLYLGKPENQTIPLVSGVWG